MKTQKERLLDLLSDMHLGQNAFERKLGVANGIISKQGDELTDNLIGKVLRCLPDVSREWLIYGNGSMYTNDQAPQTPVDKESLLIETLRDQIEMQKKYISVLEDKIAILKKEKTFADASTVHTA